MPAYGYTSADLRYLHETGVDPHEISVGKTPYGVRYATLGHYRVLWPVQGETVRQINLGSMKEPQWREVGRDIPHEDPRNDMGDFIETALRKACERYGQ